MTVEESHKALNETTLEIKRTEKEQKDKFNITKCENEGSDLPLIPLNNGIDSSEYLVAKELPSNMQWILQSVTPNNRDEPGAT